MDRFQASTHIHLRVSFSLIAFLRGFLSGSSTGFSFIYFFAYMQLSQNPFLWFWARGCVLHISIKEEKCVGICHLGSGCTSPRIHVYF